MVPCEVATGSLKQRLSGWMKSG